MPKKVLGWYYTPSKPKVDELTKERVKKECDAFIESVLKPRFITNEESSLDGTTLIDIYSKWWKNFIHINAIYQDTRPQAIKPSYDWKLARIEYMKENEYNLAYFRHTGKWWTIFYEIPLEECFEAIEDMPHFHPS